MKPVTSYFLFYKIKHLTITIRILILRKFAACHYQKNN